MPRCAALVLALLLVEFVHAAATPRPTPPPLKEGMEDELRKFYKPGENVLPIAEKPGPAGGPWDAQYRSLMQENDEAVGKGLPSHEEAAQAILADAGKNPDDIPMHEYYILFVMNYGGKNVAYEGANELKRLYRKLVYIRHRMKPPWEPSNPPPDKTLPFEGDPRPVIHRDVEYGRDDPAAQNLDAYLVKSDKPAPVMVEIHGGGWRRGAKNQFTPYYPDDLPGKLFDAGISLVSINYRMTGKYPFPAATDDTVRAVQFVKTKAKEWNIDPRRVAVMGGSAGGHLSQWIALHDDFKKADSADPVERESSRVRCFVDFWGPSDFTRFDPEQIVKESERGVDFMDAFEQAFAMPAFEMRTPEGRAKVKAYSPLYLVSSDDPPALIYHKTGDDLMGKDHPPVPEIVNDGHSAWYGVLLADAMDKAGVENTRYMGPIVGQDPEKDAEKVMAFLRKNLVGD